MSPRDTIAFLGALTACSAACWGELEPRSRGGDGGNGGGGGTGASMPVGGGPVGSGGSGPPAPGGYYTEGNTIHDENDVVHVFRGVARPSLEWNKNGENLSPDDYQRMASWGANVVRIALNQDFWLPGSSVYAPEYESNVDQNIEWAKAAGLDVILDLHWSDKGNLATMPEQQRMADQNSITFWQQVAGKYKDDGRVLFELYNEPHDVSWSVWLNGGDSGDGFQAAGMQTLYDAVRATGANNLVIVGGLDWAYDLSGITEYAVQGYNIVYAVHLYPFANKLPSMWEADWGFLAPSVPIIISEFGNRDDCGTDYSHDVVDYAAERGLSWTGWAWYVGGCGFPSLIVDWAATPSAQGQVVMSALQ